MTALRPPRGGAPVGFLKELDPVEAAAVRCLRCWGADTEAETRLCAEFAGALGPEQGGRVTETLSDICSLCALHGRRPLMRHAETCPCLGADECCFATFIAAASSGDREDAMLFAAMLVRADLAPALAGLAERLGLALRRMALRRADETTPRETDKTGRLH